MFETAELNRQIDRKDYKKQLPELRAELLQAQFALSKTNTPVIIIVSGIDGAGRGDVVNALNEWLDTRGLETIAIDSLTDEESERPYYWRFWRSLPARGRIGVFFGGWYVEPIVKTAYQKMDTVQFNEAMTHIRRFETMLVEDGALILKFWLHLSQKEQHKRLKKLETNPHTKRSVSKRDWKHADLYEQFVKTAEQAIRHTDSGNAPWLLVEATDWCYRNLTVAHTVLETLRKHLDAQSKSNTEQVAATQFPPIQSSDSKTILDTVDLSQKLRSKDYRKELETYQGKLHRLAWAAYEKKCSTIIVFEGWDAGGKGGAIRRITQAMDARLYRVISSAAPTDEERAHHYLWRFWRHIARAGRVTIYDRSWYGRVLVERVEGFAQEKEWQRAYLEINDFEEQLVKHGSIILKFWLHISQDEQLRRFKEREKIPYKQHKITEEDWRNREKWENYSLAVNEMVARTSTDFAPWMLVAGDDKRFARVQVLKTMCKYLEKALD
ncbi:MAG: polyphosphate:AMP phosphotransferase [Gammaproteobacteria bacterium]|nr:MAG: polyphosphate:AMP phosphotransferase [Gammaproteobacteria bacterium]RKZ40577.1 MAG: polyphosphate:AMP phosphotransferase [Gammaproteobacteria bacterium]RKZ76287.1 MAG: polyphosphate:AMP phosphotransferase [Gammaproteobacteria bacterium]